MKRSVTPAPGTVAPPGVAEPLFIAQSVPLKKVAQVPRIPLVLRASVVENGPCHF